MKEHYLPPLPHRSFHVCGSVRTLEEMGFTYVPYNPAWDLVVANMGLVPVVAAGLSSVA